MADDQRHGRIFGVLFIITFIASIGALALFLDWWDHPASPSIAQRKPTFPVEESGVEP